MCRAYCFTGLPSDSVPTVALYEWHAARAGILVDPARPRQRNKAAKRLLERMHGKLRTTTKRASDGTAFHATVGFKSVDMSAPLAAPSPAAPTVPVQVAHVPALPAPVEPRTTLAAPSSELPLFRHRALPCPSAPRRCGA